MKSDQNIIKETYHNKKTAERVEYMLSNNLSINQKESIKGFKSDSKSHLNRKFLILVVRKDKSKAIEKARHAGKLTGQTERKGNTGQDRNHS